MPERYRFARASPTRGKLAEAPWTLGHATLICTCLAGAAPTRRIEDGLAAAGFTDIRIAIKPGSREVVASWAPGRGIEDYVASATIEGRKPRRRSSSDSF